MSQQSSAPVKSTAISFEIIETLRERDGAGVSELAEALDMPKSTVHGHLRTLTDRAYLVNRDGQYHVGTRFLELGGYARSRMKLYRVAKPEIKKLAEQTGEHANLLVEEHGRGIFLDKARGDDAVQLDTYAGMRVHLHTTALGKAILAYLPEERVREIAATEGLIEVTENTITDLDVLEEELTAIRDRGYAIDDEERIQGMRCIAAPIIDSDGTPLGAASISSPVRRIDGDMFAEEIPHLVKSTANVIEVNMSYS